VKVILLGATGMVGQGVLRECLLDPGVERVLTIARNATPHSGTRNCKKSYTKTFRTSPRWKASSRATSGLRYKLGAN